jgi:hypothetical protein
LFVEAGGLMSYGPSHTDLYRRASVHSFVPYLITRSAFVSVH